MQGGGPLNLEQLKQLIQLFSDSDIGELKLETDAYKIALRKAAQAEGVPVAPQIVQAAPPVVPAAPAETPAPEPAPAAAEKGGHITAPMVGTFYRAPAPDAEPFVQVGDIVEPGQPLCIIEAMKLMNEIEAERRGRIVEILVENAETVEYGQPLFVLEDA